MEHAYVQSIQYHNRALLHVVLDQITSHIQYHDDHAPIKYGGLLLQIQVQTHNRRSNRNCLVRMHILLLIA